MSYLNQLDRFYREPRQPQKVTSLLGPLELVTAPQAGWQVVTRVEAKAQCRVEHTADDSFIDGLVRDATPFVEQMIDGHRQLLTATYRLPVRGFWSGSLRLPRPPLQSVGSVKYYANDGTLTTLDSSLYLVRTPLRAPGTIERAPQQVWPGVQCDRQYPVEVTYTCGYGDGLGSPRAIPGTLRRAVLLVVAEWYEHRKPGEALTPETLRAVESLCSSESWGSYA